MAGTITYSQAANAITAVGGTVGAPIGFADLWNADKAGTLGLHPATAYGNGFGKTDVGGSSWLDGGNYLLACKYVLSESCKANQISVYLKAIDNPAGQVSVGIYANSGGAPSSIVVQSGSQTEVLNAWNDFAISAHLNAGTYWLVVCFGTKVSANHGAAYAAGATNQACYAAYTFGSFPSTFPSPTYISRAVSMKVAYTPDVFSLTQQVRPADYLGLKLSLAVTNFSAAGTVALSGKDAWGNAQSETLNITGNGTVASTKYYSSIDSGGVAVAGGAFTVAISQPQWGVIWKQAASQYAFDCRIVVGDDSTATFFTDTRKTIIFSLNSTNNLAIDVRINAFFTLGTLVDAATKNTRDGCAITNADSSVSNDGYLIYGRAANSVFLYSCTVISTIGTNGNCKLCGIARMWNCLLMGDRVYLRGIIDLDLYNVTASDPVTAGYQITASSVMDKFTVYNPSYVGFYLENGNTIGNTTLINEQNKTAYAWGMSGSAYLINCISAFWSFLWFAGTTLKVYRQYEFDLAVTDKDNTALQSATVTLTDKDGTQIFSSSTNVNGNITTQTVTRGYYQQSTGDALQDESPHTLTVSKSSYQTYIKKFTLTEKTKWAIKLAKAQPILIDCGKPVANLKPVDPENKIVSSL